MDVEHLALLRVLGRPETDKTGSAVEAVRFLSGCDPSLNNDTLLLCAQDARYELKRLENALTQRSRILLAADPQARLSLPNRKLRIQQLLADEEQKRNQVRRKLWFIRIGLIGTALIVFGWLTWRQNAPSTPLAPAPLWNSRQVSHMWKRYGGATAKN
jgi:hypothetical protein